MQVFSLQMKNLNQRLIKCLVKLTNRREDLRKVNHKGRGFAYALPIWYDDRNRLMKEYKLK